MTESSSERRRQANREAFATQAADFERPKWVFTNASILEWIAESVAVSESDRVLDVAGGTGALGRYLGRGASSTVVCDLTAEMLAAGAAAAAEEGRSDVLYVRGDAAELPFADDQFDVVVCRFALHHMADPAAVIGEMARAARPGATIAVIDMVAAAGAEGERHNELERLRDPSHSTALGEQALRSLFADAGIELAAESVREQRMDAMRWIAQAKPRPEAAAELERVFREEAAGGLATGLLAGLEDGELTIGQGWLLLAGRTAAGP